MPHTHKEDTITSVNSKSFSLHLNIYQHASPKYPTHIIRTHRNGAQLPVNQSFPCRKRAPLLLLHWFVASMRQTWLNAQKLLITVLHKYTAETDDDPFLSNSLPLFLTSWQKDSFVYILSLLSLQNRACPLHSGKVNATQLATRQNHLWQLCAKILLCTYRDNCEIPYSTYTLTNSASLFPTTYPATFADKNLEKKYLLLRASWPHSSDGCRGGRHLGW